MRSAAALDTTVAIFAPRGRDAIVARDLLGRDDISCVIVSTFSGLVDLLRKHIGAVLITEEALADEGLAAVQEVLLAQPSWSDVPFIVLADGAVEVRSASARNQIDVLRNAVLLSRPLHSEELLRAVKSALSARLRQHDARRRMEEIRQREADLRESEAKLHAITNSIDQMVWSTRPDGHHDYFNDRWYEFTGTPYGSSDGEGWSDLLHADDRERTYVVWLDCLTTGRPYEIEYRLRHRSGVYRWVLARAKPARNTSGDIIRWYGTCTDIHDEVSERQARFDALTQQRDTAWELSQDLLSITDAEGRFTVLSPSWLRILGYQIEQLIRAPALHYVHADDLQKATRMLVGHRVEGEVEKVEIRMRHRDGSYRVVSWLATSKGEMTYAFGRDITESRARDAALASAEAELRQSQKLDMIGQLTGGVAHDFNNLLMAIQSSLNLLRRRMPDLRPELLNFIDNAVSATDRGAALTQRMLAFARKQELRFDDVDLAELVQNLRELLLRSVGPQIEIEIISPMSVPKARVDRNQLEMALLNLAVNARDAMNGIGKLSIIISAASHANIAGLSPGHYVSVAVKDTGSGMSADTLARAMEPFFTTKEVGKGTGLGLSMVHGLAKQSSGLLLLESAVGAGTTATIYLPAIEQCDEKEETPAPSDPVPPPSPEPELDRSLNILFVDDDFLVALGTRGMLEDLGHNVTSANSGRDGLKALADDEAIDVLITDYAMPKMTGIELARQARIIRPRLPILLATGYADMPEGSADCIDAMLEKPFSEASLAAALRGLVR
ncbi:hybrid sensor histidine kinase/response regulator [Cypionkella sp.]|uniref:hybrid sensor histidine kinase/response regulator n=1 Tax=Cypionkella sp. TaxID=2811411 RepID=UPI00262D734E|nr:hybrid sensor histidine kinase/response regulator [Cypionkella sp.]